MKTIGIEIDTDTRKLSMKLHAIANHLISLADELEIIDRKNECAHCGSYNTFTLYAEDRIVQVECDDCNKVVAHDDDLPTRLEGSE